MTYALYGLAALQQPVLPRLQAWMTREDLSVKERLYTALAAYALGEGETARALFRAIVRDYAQVKEPHIVIKAGETNDEILTNTALAAVLASFLNEPQQYGLRDYLHYHRPAEILLALEDLNFAQASLRRRAFVFFIHRKCLFVNQKCPSKIDLVGVQIIKSDKGCILKVS